MVKTLIAVAAVQGVLAPSKADMDAYVNNYINNTIKNTQVIQNYINQDTITVMVLAIIQVMEMEK